MMGFPPGMAVVGGVVTSTFLVTIFAPLFFVYVGAQVDVTLATGETPTARPLLDHLERRIAFLEST